MLGVIILIVLGLMPTWVSLGRGHRNLASIIATNVLLGWTLIGWIIALIWSFSDNVEKE